jgi:hypothetical protein
VRERERRSLGVVGRVKIRGWNLYNPVIYIPRRSSALPADDTERAQIIAIEEARVSWPQSRVSPSQPASVCVFVRVCAGVRSPTAEDETRLDEKNLGAALRGRTRFSLPRGPLPLFAAVDAGPIFSRGPFGTIRFDSKAPPHSSRH